MRLSGRFGAHPLAARRGAGRAGNSWPQAYEADGYAVDIWKIDVDAIRDLPGFSPVAVSYDEAYNVVARHTPAARRLAVR